MSLLDKLRHKRAEEAAEALTVVVPSAPAISSPAASVPPRPTVTEAPSTGPAAWIGPGQSVTLHAITIPDGMIYVGSSRGPGDRARDPSLIDPQLPIDLRSADFVGANLRYYPAYRDIPPTSRAAYLVWLATGRKRPDIGIGYVFIYFYGLERRVLIDCRKNAMHKRDLPAIRAEIERLLALYGPASGSFRQYAASLLGLIQLQSDPNPTSDLHPPLFGGDRWRVPPVLKLAIAQFADKGEAVPAEWAMAWIQHRSEIVSKAAALRCPDEYARLFAIRYREQFGDGLIPARGWQPLRLDYRPASSALQQISVPASGLTDAFDDGGSVAALRKLSDDVATELAPFAKWRKKNPDAPIDSVSALAVVPSALVDRLSGQSLALLSFLHQRIGEATCALVPLAEIRPYLGPGPFARQDAIGLAQALEVFGFGIEPDIRFSGTTPAANDSVAIFVHGPEGTSGPGPAFATASLLAQLAVAVAGADGEMSHGEGETVIHQITARLDFTAAERTRLDAHMMWLESRTMKPASLRAKLAVLSVDQRRSAGDLIVAVAAADGQVGPAETALVQRIFVMLGLEPDDALQHLFAASTGGEIAQSRSGSTITRPTQAKRADLSLNEEVIAHKIQQSQSAAALIASVFGADEDGEPSPPPVEPAGAHVAILSAHAESIGMDPGRFRSALPLGRAVDIGRDRYA